MVSGPFFFYNFILFRARAKDLLTFIFWGTLLRERNEIIVFKNKGIGRLIIPKSHLLIFSLLILELSYSHPPTPFIIIFFEELVG